MYAVVRTESFPEDEGDDPVGPDISVILFPNQDLADEFISNIPISNRVTWLLLQPDESHLQVENPRKPLHP